MHLSFIAISVVIKGCIADDTLCITLDNDDASGLYTYSLTQDNIDNYLSENDNSEKCWDIQLGACYTYHIGTDNPQNQQSSSNLLSVTVNDRIVGIFDATEHVNISTQHFCVSPDLQYKPLKFPGFGESSTATNKNEIYHRDREVYASLDVSKSQICVGFKATQLVDDNLSLQLPEISKSCDDVIHFNQENGYCECFGGSIMVNVMEEEQGTCANICESSYVYFIYLYI